MTRLTDLPKELLEEVYPHVDIPFALRATCRAFRDAFTAPLVALCNERVEGKTLGTRVDPPKTKTAIVHVVKDVRLIAWACSAYCHWSDRLALCAAEHGYEEALNYLVMFRGFELDGRVPATAAANGQLATLTWLYENGAGCVWDHRTCNAAAANGFLDCLSYAFSRSCPFSNSGFNCAARNGHYLCVEFMLAQNASDWRWKRTESKVCDYAAMGGHVRILQLLREYQLPWGMETTQSAAQNGHLECLQWLLQQGCRYEYVYCFQDAACNGHVDVVRWIMTQWTPQWGHFHDELLEDLASSGDVALPVLKFAQECGADVRNGALVTCAAHAGSLNGIKWLLEQGALLDHDEIPEAAATSGDLNVLNWVAEQPNMVWNNHSYDGAIQSHHVHVLEWAYNAKKLDGPWADDCLSRRVAQWGNTEMAKWVVDNGFVWSEIATRTNKAMARLLAHYLNAYPIWAK
jgi:hypothetical protein